MAVENKKITDLAQTDALGGSELLVAAQNGVSVSVSADLIAKFAAAKVEIPETSGGVQSVNGVKPDENGNVEITIPEDEDIAITQIESVLTSTTLTTTLDFADNTQSVIVGTYTDGLLTNLNVDGTDVPVSMEGF